jgi:hypothetical protein
VGRNKRSKLEAKAFHMDSSVSLHCLSVNLGCLTAAADLLHLHSEEREAERIKKRLLAGGGCICTFTVNPSYVVHVYIYRPDREGFFFFGGQRRKYNNIIGILERRFWNRSGSIRCQMPAGQGKNVGAPAQKDG